MQFKHGPAVSRTNAAQFDTLDSQTLHVSIKLPVLLHACSAVLGSSTFAVFTSQSWPLGIAVEWFNEERDKIYNRPQPGDTVSESSFEENETAIWSIRAGLRLVKLEFDTTTGQHWNARGDTGTLYPRIANGSVIGFQGMLGWSGTESCYSKTTPWYRFSPLWALGFFPVP